MNSFNILVGGEAGQGLVSISHMLIKAVASAEGQRCPAQRRGVKGGGGGAEGRMVLKGNDACPAARWPLV